MKKTTHHHIEQPLGRILSYTGKSFLYLINEKLARLDIERNFYALLLIEESEGSITQQELANLLDSDKVSIMRSIDYLSETGYVKRYKNADDKRKYSLMLTAKAKRDLPKIKKALNEVTNTAFKNIRASKITEFYSILATIKNNLDYKNSDL
jgi:DNA-binding MarR family transcriptional regulator